jgi:hypothetical protein
VASESSDSPQTSSTIKEYVMKKSNLNLTETEIRLIKLQGQLGLLKSEKDRMMHEMVLMTLKKKD